MVQEPDGTRDGRASRHAHRRSEILDAIVAHVLAHGWTGSTLRSIADSIGLSHRAVLYHFETKDRLLREVVAEVRRREQERVRAAGEDGQPLAELLQRTWERVTAPDHLPYVRLHFELQSLALADPDQGGGWVADLVESWVEVVAAVLRRAGVAGPAATRIATWVYALIRGLQLDLLSTGDRTRVNAAMADAVPVVVAWAAAAAGGSAASSSHPCKEA